MAAAPSEASVRRASEVHSSGFRCQPSCRRHRSAGRPSGNWCTSVPFTAAMTADQPAAKRQREERHAESAAEQASVQVRSFGLDFVCASTEKMPPLAPCIRTAQLPRLEAEPSAH